LEEFGPLPGSRGAFAGFGLDVVVAVQEEQRIAKGAKPPRPPRFWDGFLLRREPVLATGAADDRWMDTLTPMRDFPSKIEPVLGVDQLARVVVDAALEVHRTLGPGFSESVYERALAAELNLRSILFERQVAVPLLYKGVSVGDGRLDLLVADCLVVELKAVEALAPVHVAQILSYLRASRHSLGLLITFNVRQLRQGLKRVVLSH
jgi:GxxExxY protein